ncbi:MAG: PAS domain-containing sensor histidine kinase [Anaerolineae bacterium]
MASVALIMLIYSNLRIFRPLEKQLHNHQESLRQQIKELHEIQDAFLTERRRYSALFHQNNDAVFFLNLQGQHIAANERAAQMFGYTIDEILKLSRTDIIVPEQHTDSDRVLERLINHETIPVYERLVRHKDGHIFPVEMNVALVRNHDDTPLLIQSIMRDITDRKQLDQQALELAVEREKLHLIAEFGHATSHDLRTPLSVINVNVHLMAKTPDLERRQERAKRIEEEVNKLNAMIDDLQLLSRLEAGMPYDTETIDLNQVAESAAHRLNSLIASREHQLEYDLESGGVVISGAVDYLIVCAVALLENAALYTPPKGHLILRTCRVNGKGCLQVIDNGVGIASHEVENVFDPLYKANKARTTDQSRGGLGLALVKKIVALHHGSISVQSEVGKGSTFSIELPMEPIMA